MLTIKGNRRVSLSLELKSVTADGALVGVTIEVEGEPMEFSERVMKVGDKITTSYRLDMDGAPLTHADMLAMLRGEKPEG